MHLTPEQCERAKELLDNPFFDFICDDVFQEIASEWKEAQSSARRDELWREQRLIRRLKTRLMSAANSDTLRQRALSKQQR